ncbi:MAG TPA: hypothetical protein VG737_17300, partial [Cyclobacteriaceae bacterium]|nr:hypothetical protein [Cyclobacteriaceae bacterium]
KQNPLTELERYVIRCNHGPLKIKDAKVRKTQRTGVNGIGSYSSADPVGVENRDSYPRLSVV